MIKQGLGWVLRAELGRVGLAALLAVVGTGCGNSNKTSSCQSGSEQCSCYGNDTCNSGLRCLSHLCVSDPEGTGGANAGGATAGPGAGNSSIGGGTASSGGSSSVAGGISTNTGGSNVTGGASTVGGATGTGEGGLALGGATSSPGVGGIGLGGLTSSSLNTGGSPGVGGTGTGGTTVAASGFGGVAVTGGAATVSGTSATGGASSVPTTGNLVKNGDFSQGSAYWNVTLITGAMKSTFEGAYCGVEPSSGVASLGWPLNVADAFSLEAGATYTLAYRATTTLPQYWSTLTLEAKVGHAVDPFTPAYTVTDEVANTSTSGTWVTHTHQFVATAADSAAGVSFTIASYQNAAVCIDDVALTKN